MKRTIATAALTLAALAASTAAATAVPHLYHRSDDGYDPPIIVKCRAGDSVSWDIYEGADTLRLCEGIGIARLYIRSGEEMRCLRVDYYGDTYWDRSFDAAGRHDVPGSWSDGKGCALWLD